MKPFILLSGSFLKLARPHRSAQQPVQGLRGNVNDPPPLAPTEMEKRSLYFFSDVVRRLKSDFRSMDSGMKKQDAEAAALLREGVFLLNECSRYSFNQFEQTDYLY